METEMSYIVTTALIWAAAGLFNIGAYSQTKQKAIGEMMLFGAVGPIGTIIWLGVACERIVNRIAR